MSKDHRSPLSRRRFLAASGAASTLLASPALAQMTGTTELEQDVTQTVRRNVSSFRALDWRDRKSVV